jgi:hypothetical protein
MILSIFGTVPPGALLPGALELTVTVWLTMLGGMAMGLLISALATNSDKATSLVPLILVPQILLAGLIFPLHGPTEALSYATVSKWATDSLGTTADLNRLYYQYLASAPPGIRPALRPAALDTYRPANYDQISGPRAAYTPASHLASRRAHLTGRWLILLLLISGFVGLTCYIQAQKDKDWGIT